MKAVMVKNMNALRAADEAGESLLASIGQGELVQVEIRRPRNIAHHRLFFALMGLVWHQLDHEKYPTVEALVDEVKIITGHYDRRDIVWEGKRYPVVKPKSIAFHNMDQTEFKAFFDRVCDWVSKEVLPGVTQEDLREELEIMTGQRQA